MIHKTRGLVLHHIKYRESGIIVYMFTENFGRQTFLVQGMRRKGSAGNINLFQPLFQLDLDVYYRVSRNMHRIKEFKSHVSYSTIPFSVTKRSIVLFLAEILYRCLKTQESAPKLYQYLSNALIFLDQTNESVANFHFIFLLQLIRFLGFQPNISAASAHACFDLREGVFRSGLPNHPFYIPKPHASLFYDLLKSDFQTMNSFSFSQADRICMMEYIIDYYQLHDQELSGLKSLKILKDVFSSSDLPSGNE